MTVYFDSRRMKMSTGEFINPKDWNPETCRPRKNAPNSIVLHTYLDRLEAKVKETMLKMKSEFVIITPDSLKQALLRNARNGGKKETFMQFIDRFIEESRPVRKPGSLSVYTSVRLRMEEFPGQKDFNDICSDWFRRYQAYMESKGYAANYIGKNVGVIRELMTIAKSKGLHHNDAYKDPDYKKPSEDAENIYLNNDELMAIYNVRLSEALDHVRCRFLIGAFTGLRFSDSAKITPESIREGLVFDKNKKTGSHVVIPVHWVVEEIMAKYPGGLPPAISNQKTNSYLKIIGQKAGITTLIEKHQRKGGKDITTTTEKYNLITTHTARRSAVSNMVLAGVPIVNIMPITGHKTESSFKKYVKLSAEENARSISDHPYFQRPVKD